MTRGECSLQHARQHNACFQGAVGMSEHKQTSTEREPDCRCGTHHPGRAGVAIQNLQAPTGPAAGDLHGVVTTAAKQPEIRC